MPALLKTASSAPKRETARATAASTSSGSPTSATTAIASPRASRIAETVASAATRSRSTTTTRAPSSANRRAAAPPIAPPPPVTSTTLPGEAAHAATAGYERQECSTRTPRRASAARASITVAWPCERGTQLDLAERPADQRRRVLLHEGVVRRHVDGGVPLHGPLERGHEHARGIARIDVRPEVAGGDARVAAAAHDVAREGLGRLDPGHPQADRGQVAAPGRGADDLLGQLLRQRVGLLRRDRVRLVDRQVRGHDRARVERQRRAC